MSSSSEDPDGSDHGAVLIHDEQADEDPYSPGVSPVATAAQPIERAVDQLASFLRVETLDPDDSSNNKRKSPSPATSDQPARAKRVRLDESSSGRSRDVPDSPLDRSTQLPAEVWHRILTFVPPKALGRLMRVNKIFQRFLDPRLCYDPPNKSPPSSRSILKPLHPNAIWQYSRERSKPGVPHPIKGMTEFDMWRLACSRSCQVCGMKGDLLSHKATSPWHFGPGVAGVSPVFAFRISLCGSCLLSGGKKDADLSASHSIPSSLFSSLPAVYITDEGHIVPANHLKGELSSLPPRLTQIFWPKQIEDFSEEYKAVERLGPGAMEEWMKGLEGRGQKAIADVVRWVNWELASGVWFMRKCTTLGTLPADPVPTTTSGFVSPQAATGHATSTNSQIPAGHKAPPTGPRAERATQDPGPVSNQRQISSKTEIPGLMTKTQVNSRRVHLQTLEERKKQEVDELRRKRRAEIESRALLLDPPLSPDVLARLPSFQAALQVVSPLDDAAWERLRLQLIAQSEEAEPTMEGLEVTKGPSEDTLQTQKETKTTPQAVRTISDSDWDEAQGPLRRRIADIADKFIRDSWRKGVAIRKKEARRFASEVLLHVRERFYSEVASDATAAVTASLAPVEDPPEGPWTQKLTLENMKWVFESKIRPCIQMYLAKGIFFCNGCNDGTSKTYGLDGVLQHYAAKHTASLSVGNIVVFWRAEWPEVAPFSPVAHGSQSSLPSKPPSKPQDLAASHAYDADIRFTSGPSLIYPTYGYGVPLPPQTVSFPSSSATAGNSLTQACFAQDGSYSSHSSTPLSGGVSLYPGQSAAENVALTSMPEGYRHGSYPNTQVQYTHQLPTDPTVTYKMRLETMIRVAREAWNLIEGIQDLSSSVKVCVVVHRIAKTFQDHFAEAAPLLMLIDALSNQQDMRPIRNTNELACKACFMGQNVHARLSFSFPQLTNHFHEIHVETPASQGFQPLDWRIDMILLPDVSLLRELEVVLKRIPPAYALLAETLPWAFEGDQLDQAVSGRSSDVMGSSSTKVPIESDDPSFGSGSLDRGRRLGRDASGANQQPLPIDGSHQQAEHTGDMEPLNHPAPSRSPSYSPEPPNLVPYLRPAREYYKRLKPHGNQMQGRYVTESSTPWPARLGRPSEPTAEMSHRRTHLASGYHPEAHGHHHSSHHHSQYQPLDAQVPDYRDVESSRYASRDALASSGGAWSARRWQGDVQPERELPRPISEVSPTRPGHNWLSAPAHHQSGPEVVHDEVIYLDSSGREVGRERRPIEARSREARVIYHDRLEPGVRRPTSPLYAEYSPGDNRDQIFRLRFESESRQHRPEHATHRVYGDELSTWSGLPVDAYELVKVHDPMGDYFIRRPVRIAERDHYDHGGMPPPRDPGLYPHHGSIGSGRPARPMGSEVEARLPSQMEYEEYDPRYPAPSSRERSRHQREINIEGMDLS